MEEYDSGNAKNTVSFLEKLRELNAGNRLLIIWYGASYHRYKEMKDYLNENNQNLEASERPIHQRLQEAPSVEEGVICDCEILAPNAPEQNPVEDIWLKAKNFLRKFWYKLNSFALVKWLFKFFLQNEVFEFAKLHKYGFFTQKRGQ